MGFIRKLTGQGTASAITEGAGIQGQAIEKAIGTIQPFQQLGEQAIGQAGFLTDPQAQFDFLQSNPLFKMALESANTGTTNLAAARGRLSAGDTLQDLSKNVLLSASPLIQQQKGSITDLLNIGAGATGNIADLITTGGATEAAGLGGAAQAKQAASQNLLQTALLGGSLFSDKRLKQNIKKIGSANGHNIYSWTWNTLAKIFNLSGSGFGVLADEVIEKNPSAVVFDRGFMKVDYSAIGIPHGS